MLFWFIAVLLLLCGTGVWHDYKNAIRGTSEHLHSDEATDAYRNRKAKPDDYQGWG